MRGIVYKPGAAHLALYFQEHKKTGHLSTKRGFVNWAWGLSLPGTSISLSSLPLNRICSHCDSSASETEFLQKLFPYVEARKQSQQWQNRCLNPVPPFLSLLSPSCWRTNTLGEMMGKIGLEFPVRASFYKEAGRAEMNKCGHQVKGIAISQWLVRWNPKEIQEYC